MVNIEEKIINSFINVFFVELSFLNEENSTTIYDLIVIEPIENVI